jgi:DNA-binding IclR family transcriptional regulator
VLASLSDDELESYLRRGSPGRPLEASIRASFWRNIHEVRKNRYVINYCGGPPYMVKVAFQILDENGYVHGAISAGGPVERFDPRLTEILPKLRSIAEELNSRMRLLPPSTGTIR